MGSGAYAVLCLLLLLSSECFGASVRPGKQRTVEEQKARSWELQQFLESVQTSSVRQKSQALNNPLPFEIGGVEEEDLKKLLENKFFASRLQKTSAPPPSRHQETYKNFLKKLEEQEDLPDAIGPFQGQPLAPGSFVPPPGFVVRKGGRQEQKTIDKLMHKVKDPELDIDPSISTRTKQIITKLAQIPSFMDSRKPKEEEPKEGVQIDFNSGNLKEKIQELEKTIPVKKVDLDTKPKDKSPAKRDVVEEKKPEAPQVEFDRHEIFELREAIIEKSGVGQILKEKRQKEVEKMDEEREAKIKKEELQQEREEKLRAELKDSSRKRKQEFRQKKKSQGAEHHHDLSSFVHSPFVKNLRKKFSGTTGLVSIFCFLCCVWFIVERWNYLALLHRLAANGMILSSFVWLFLLTQQQGKNPTSVLFEQSKNDFYALHIGLAVIYFVVVVLNFFPTFIYGLRKSDAVIIFAVSLVGFMYFSPVFNGAKPPKVPLYGAFVGLNAVAVFLSFVQLFTSSSQVDDIDRKTEKIAKDKVKEEKLKEKQQEKAKEEEQKEQEKEIVEKADPKKKTLQKRKDKGH